MLRVEHNLAGAAPTTLTIGTEFPRFGFLIPSTSTSGGEGEGEGEAVSVGGYRVKVMDSNTLAWDSGRVNSSDVVSIRCGNALKTLTSYTWTAQWFDPEGLCCA